MSSTCPGGHVSTADDYCDTCGAPMVAASPPAVAPASDTASPADSARPADSEAADSAAPAMQECPHCSTRNLPDALFCEACGYDFTTGVMPRPIALADGSFLDLGTPEASGTRSPSTAGPPEPTEGKAHTAPAAPQAPATPTRAPSSGSLVAPRPDPATPREKPSAAARPTSPTPPTQAEPFVSPAAPSRASSPTRLDPASTGRRPTYRPPSREIGGDWVVEVWIDPDWYDVQDSDDPRPSPAVPDIVRLLSTTAMVGRPSASRNIRPDIDCGSDTGVSRRQAQLSTDGRRWWVEDLDSANGTYVGPASGPLPADPVEPGRRVEVDADDRIYVGAWTRLVVRKATDSESTDL